MLGRMEEIAANYLQDLGYLLRERLDHARQEAEAASGPSREFEAGRYRAYREVLSLMLTQAEAFELPVEALSLQDVDRDRELGC